MLNDEVYREVTNTLYSGWWYKDSWKNSTTQSTTPKITDQYPTSVNYWSIISTIIDSTNFLEYLLTL